MRWIQEGATIHTETGWLGDCDADVDATRINAAHNAACDAYEARIAEIQSIPEIAELMRRHLDEGLADAVRRLRNERNDLCNKVASRNERIAELEAQAQEANKRANDAEHRLEFPPMTRNQDELARICYEAYREYTSPGSLEDNPWSELSGWDTYGWRLAADRVRVAVEGAIQGRRRADES